MVKRDHLSNEVSLDVVLTEKGITGKARLRSLAALDRLLGSLIDIPASRLEAISNRIRAKSDREVKLICSDDSLDPGLLENDELLSRLVESISQQQALNQAANRISVGMQAIERLGDVRPDEHETETNPLEEDALDDDWLNHFEKYAEQASSERMRDLWARVLAGEIRRPHSFSLVTLRFLSELDKEIAALFEEETKYWLNGGFILMPQKEEMKGERLLGLTFLEEVGLLQDVVMGMQQTLNPNEDGIVHSRQGQFILVAGTEKPLKLSLIRLTRIGREIARILPARDCMEVLTRIERRIHNDIEYSNIALVVSEGKNGLISFRMVKSLKEKTQQL